jgi:hypothetical protein
VPGLAHVTERFPGPADVPGPYRGRRQFPGGEQPGYPQQDFLKSLGPGIAGLERPVVHSRMAGRDLAGVAFIGVAHLDEHAAAGQQPQRRVGQLPGQRVQHDVHPGTAGRGQERRFEVPVPGGGDVIGGQAHLGQHRVLGRARGGEHLQAQVAGNADRGRPDPAGRGVHQQSLPGPGAGQVGQGVPGGAVRHRHGGRGGE